MQRESVKIEIFSDVRMAHGEGPIWNSEKEELWLTSVRDNKIHCLTMVGATKCHRVLPQKCRSMFFSRNSMYVALEDGVYRVAGDETIPFSTTHVVDTGFLNDGKVGPDGRFYVGQGDVPAGNGRFFRLERDGSFHSLFEGQMLSNGLAWSPQGTALYHTDTRKKRIDVYDFDAETGTLSSPRLAFDLEGKAGEPDGFTIDEEGCLWVCMMRGGNLLRIDPVCGKLLDRCRMPVTTPTSCAFAGPKMDYLVITTSSAVKDLSEEPLAGFTLACRPGVRGPAPNLFLD